MEGTVTAVYSPGPAVHGCAGDPQRYDAVAAVGRYRSAGVEAEVDPGDPNPVLERGAGIANAVRGNRSPLHDFVSPRPARSAVDRIFWPNFLFLLCSQG